MGKEQYSSGEVANLLGIPARTARRYITKGKIGAVQNPVTGTWRISRESLITFMNEYDLDPSLLLSSVKILIISSSNHWKARIANALLQANDDMHIERATNGYEAMLKIGEVKPDIICLYLVIDDLDKGIGKDFISILKISVKTADIKVIVISDAEAIISNMQNYGADDGLIIPFNPESLVEKVSLLISSIAKGSE